MDYSKLSDDDKKTLAGLCHIEIKRWNRVSESNHNMRYMLKLMEIALASLTDESNWIKCSERMPDDNDEYYLTYSKCGVDVGYFYDGHFQDLYVTHWHPLPKPPEE
jgi:hypothetical protein